MLQLIYMTKIKRSNLKRKEKKLTGGSNEVCLGVGGDRLGAEGVRGDKGYGLGDDLPIAEADRAEERVQRLEAHLTHRRLVHRQLQAL